MADDDRPRSGWRDNLEAMTMAIVMALLLKHFVVEAYKIPTGSMQPTLIGDEGIGVYDRILVDKLCYHLRDPQRWEVVIFRYPLDRSKNFVKRVAGVGPEELRIQYGDLWRRDDDSQPWEIARRPASVQQEIWKRLDLEHPAEPSWSSSSFGDAWHFEGRSIEAAGDGRARWHAGQGPVRDRYLDGYPEPLLGLLPASHAGSGEDFVGDLRLEGEIVARAGTRWVVLELQEGDLRHRFRLPGPAAAQGARPAIETLDTRTGATGGRLYSPASFRLPADAPVRFHVQNLDDRLELAAGGQVLATEDIEPAEDQRSGVALELQGGAASFRDLMVYRDIFYTPGRDPVIRVPAGCYFMLGDNTQDSSDSREWSLVRYETQERGQRVVLRGNRRLGENPLFVPGLPDGPMTRFRDEWGDVHWFPSDAATQLPPVEASFVPRDMILGHAMAVFWPLSPSLGLYRLKWVN